MRLFDVLTNFPFTTSETMRDYTVDIVESRRLLIALKVIPDISFYAGSHRKEEDIADSIPKKSSKLIKISEKQFCLKYQNFKIINCGNKN